MTARLTLLDDGRRIDVPARFYPDGVRLDPAVVAAELGWEVKPEGLCRGPLCVPVRDAAALATADGVDLAALARAVSRPLALDVEERAAYLGTSAAERAAQLATLQAPDFTLPDLAGSSRTLSNYRGKKVLLIAYASW